MLYIREPFGTKQDSHAKPTTNFQYMHATTSHYRIFTEYKIHSFSFPFFNTCTIVSRYYITHRYDLDVKGQPDAKAFNVKILGKNTQGGTRHFGHFRLALVYTTKYISQPCRGFIVIQHRHGEEGTGDGEFGHETKAGFGLSRYRRAQASLREGGNRREEHRKACEPHYDGENEKSIVSNTSERNSPASIWTDGELSAAVGSSSGILATDKHGHKVSSCNLRFTLT